MRNVVSFNLMFLKKTIDITRYRDNESPLLNQVKDDLLSQLKFESRSGLNLVNNFYEIFLESKTSENIYQLVKSF